MACTVFDRDLNLRKCSVAKTKNIGYVAQVMKNMSGVKTEGLSSPADKG